MWIIDTVAVMIKDMTHDKKVIGNPAMIIVEI